MKKILSLILCLSIQTVLFAQELSEAEVVKQYTTALTYMTKGNHRYAEARAIMEKILPSAYGEVKTRILLRLPMTWYFEGLQYQTNQNYEQALYCMKQAREGFHMASSTKNEMSAIIQTAAIKASMYDYEKALEAYRQAAVLAVNLKNDIKLMEILREEQKLNERLGDSERIQQVNMRMDSLGANTQNDHVRFEYYCHLGDEATSQNNFRMAEQWYLKNNAYIDGLGDDYLGADKYLYYSNLRTVYIKAGRWDEALKYAMLSKKEYQKTCDVTDPKYQMSYMTLADIYRLKGDSVRCFKCLDTLFISLDQFVEPREAHLLYITRARCNATFKNYRKALEDYKAADSLLATKYDNNIGERVRLLPLMGGLAHKLELHEETEQYYRQYADGIKHIYGDNRPDYIDALSYLANAEAFNGHIEEACRDYSSAVSKLKQQTKEHLPYMSVAERESYWRTASQLFLNMTPFALKAEKWQTTFTKDCYDGLVLSKAFLLESERSTYDLIKNNGTDKDLQDYSAIAAMKLSIRKLELNTSLNRDSIQKLTLKLRKLENLLVNSCLSYGEMTTFMGVGYQKIRNSLSKNDVLIDFTDFVTETRGRVYAAYLINGQQKYPLLKELFAESVIDSMGVFQPDQYYLGTTVQRLYQLLWKPFKDYVSEGATVYYVPSQLLFQIALESLPMEDGSLLGDHYQFVRLSSAREVVRNNPNLDIDITTKKVNAVLYGGLKYDLAEKVMKEEAAKYHSLPRFVARGDILRGDSVFRELPETRKEIEGIEKVLKLRHLSVRPYTGMTGTEESFLSMNGNAPQILHVATHGFYYTPNDAQKVDYLKGYTDAMSLSGLVLSGGNAAWLGKELPQGVLGGIMTAANIARIDLNGTQMAVLSACQTGQGKATPEGLFGLQRAFKKAGVRTLVMTLWNVSDVVTKEFMIKFYENLARLDWNKHKAFNEAKSYIRGKYKEPYYWAGFVILD